MNKRVVIPKGTPFKVWEGGLMGKVRKGTFQYEAHGQIIGKPFENGDVSVQADNAGGHPPTINPSLLKEE